MNEALTQQLRQWGIVQNRRTVRWEQERKDHPIAQARDFAMSRKQAQEALAGRDGRSRRRAMGQAASADVRLRLPMVPMWACDPVPARNDASPPRDVGIAVGVAFVDVDPPDDLRWIDRAVSQLSRINLVRAMCLREEFCGTGTQSIKAARVAEAYGGQLSVWMYRREVQRALDFLHARAA